MKVNGYRIELGKSGAALRDIPMWSSQWWWQWVILNIVGWSLFAKLHDRHQAQALQAKEAEAAALAQGIIVNPAQRLAFKLKEPHIRALDGLGIALTAPADRHVTSNAAAIVISARKTTLAQLGQLLSGLGQMRLPGLPFAKYAYASAGAIPGANLRCTCIQTRSKRGIRYLLLRPRQSCLMPVAPEVELNSGFHAGPNPVYCRSGGIHAVYGG